MTLPDIILVGEFRSAAQSRWQPLEVSIAQLYETFRAYPLAEDIPGCPCCITPDDNRRLCAKPLQELPAEHLHRYAFKALTTWGGVNDFRHFLPRLFELLARRELAPFVEEAIVFHKLALANWHDWPAIERESVMDYFAAFWSHALLLPPELAHADELLCAIGNADMDLGPYLRQWLEDESPIAASHLAQALFDNAEHFIDEKQLADAFWENCPDRARQFLAWSISRSVRARVDALAHHFQEGEPYLSASLFSALGLIEVLPNAITYKHGTIALNT